MFTVELHCSKTRQHVLTQRDKLKLTVNFWDASSTNLRLFNCCCCCCCSFPQKTKLQKCTFSTSLDVRLCVFASWVHFHILQKQSHSAWQHILHNCDRTLMWTHHHPQTFRPPWPCIRALSNQNLPRPASVNIKGLVVPSSGCLLSFCLFDLVCYKQERWQTHKCNKCLEGL